MSVKKICIALVIASAVIVGGCAGSKKASSVPVAEIQADDEKMKEDAASLEALAENAQRMAEMARLVEWIDSLSEVTEKYLDSMEDEEDLRKIRDGIVRMIEFIDIVMDKIAEYPEIADELGSDEVFTKKERNEGARILEMIDNHIETYKCTSMTCFSGHFALSEGEYCEAFNYFGKILKRDPDHRTEILDVLKLFDEAIDDDKSHSAKILSRRADIYKEMEAFDEAIADMDRAIRIDTSSKLYDYRARVYLAMGEFEKARADADKAIELDSLDPYAVDSRAHVQMETGEYKKAEENFARTAEMDGIHWSLNHCRALLYSFMGDEKKADSFNVILQKIADDGEDVRELDTDAIKMYGRYIERHPKNAIYLYHRGIVYMRLDDLEKAAADFKAALLLNPKHAQAKKRLAEVEKALKEKSKQ